MNWGLFGIPQYGLRPVTFKNFNSFYSRSTPVESSYDTKINHYFRSL